MSARTGFLLSCVRYGDHDAVLNFFTKEAGYETFFCRGIYSAKNKKKAFLQPLNLLALIIQDENTSGNLARVSKMEAGETISNWGMKASSVVFFLSDFLRFQLRNEAENPEIFRLLQEFVKALENKNLSAHYVLMIKMLKSFGVAPLHSEGVYLDPETGTFTGSLTSPLFTQEISALWKTILSSEEPFEIILHVTNKKELMDSIMLFYSYHFSDFRIPPSLEIVQQIFE